MREVSIFFIGGPMGIRVGVGPVGAGVVVVIGEQVLVLTFKLDPLSIESQTHKYLT